MYELSSYHDFTGLASFGITRRITEKHYSRQQVLLHILFYHHTGFKNGQLSFEKRQLDWPAEEGTKKSMCQQLCASLWFIFNSGEMENIRGNGVKTQQRRKESPKDLARLNGVFGAVSGKDTTHCFIPQGRKASSQHGTSLEAAEHCFLSQQLVEAEQRCQISNSNGTNGQNVALMEF